MYLSFNYAIAASELILIPVSLILLYGNIFETHQKTEYGTIFSWLLVTNTAALVFDAVAWSLDGNAEQTVLLYISNLLSLVMPFILIGEFALYIAAYLKVRTVIRGKMLKTALIFCLVSTVATIALCAAGMMFTIEEGIYVPGTLYPVYSALNVIAIILCSIAVTMYRKVLGTHDSIAMYTYILAPAISACINTMIEELSFVYQAITLSELIIYVMVQSEQNGRMMEEKLVSQYHASHDEMTGVLNRRVYVEKLKEMKKNDGNAGLIFCDINRLKYINDNFGHDEGDRLIKTFADQLKKYFDNDSIYRISGDEFVVINEKTDKETFIERAGKLEKAVYSDGYIMAGTGAVYGSAEDAEELVRSAEMLMYESKERFHSNHPEMNRVQRIRK